MSFSKDFLFGTSTAAYQIEGAWNVDGKGESIWDRLVHTRPEIIKDRSNGDIACNSYSLYEQDIGLIKSIGFDVYRLSISWSRILPNGEITNVNQAGVDYYHNVINETLKNGIQPMVTMYHWDLPQKLQDIGGWVNPLIVDYVEDYADLLFQLYGDKVKWWITINEPAEVVGGYAGVNYAPALNLDSPTNYIVAHNLLRAHGRIFRLYDRKYRKEQKGKITITISSRCYIAKTNSIEDLEAAERAWSFNLGWFAHPIYSTDGDYPPVMRELVDKNSKAEGRRRSRLPTFTEEEIQSLKGSFDFFALNHYSSSLCSPGKPPFWCLYVKDMNVTMEMDPKWPTSHASWLRVVPSGLRESLRYIKDHYGNPPVFITENGYCSADELNDTERINYHRDYLLEVVNAIDNYGCNVIGYTAWSILDNFEWLDGYENRFGIVHVDFTDPERKRTLKSSADFFKKLLNTRSIPKTVE